MMFLADYKFYIVIWVILVAATILEVETRFLSGGAQLLIAGIIAISSAKAVIIALYFQHLRYESNSIRLLPLGALVALGILAITAIISLGG
jgi:cytochrome c oxidase subunit 4